MKKKWNELKVGDLVNLPGRSNPVLITGLCGQQITGIQNNGRGVIGHYQLVEMAEKKDDYILVNNGTAWMSPRGGAGGWAANRWTKEKERAARYKTKRSAQRAKARLEKQGLDCKVIPFEEWMTL